jgi:hypothetical protein
MIGWVILLLTISIIFGIYGTLPDRGCVPSVRGGCLAISYEQDFGPSPIFWITAGMSSAKKKGDDSVD